MCFFNAFINAFYVHVCVGVCMRECVVIFCMGFLIFRLIALLQSACPWQVECSGLRLSRHAETKFKNF